MATGKRGHIDKMNKLMHTEDKLHMNPGAHSNYSIKKASHASETPVAPVVTNTCYAKPLKPSPKKLNRNNKKKDLHSPLVLSHKLGGELAEDVQESQV